MSYFLKSGNKFKVTTKEALDLHESLPPGTYTVGFNKCGGYFFLEHIDSFEIKGKLYGDVTRHADRILQTFMDRTASTGVLLSGEKGSGKTLLAKHISIEAASQGIPTIVINKDWGGEEFNAFIQMIEQPTIILFDEFEKVYTLQDQEKMLTLLDGVYPSKKLFLLTCNDKWRVNDKMRNRPGRIYYMIDFDGLDEKFILEYCEDNLDAKENIPKICLVAGLFGGKFNFDMLKAMVEDMNRYGETPTEVLKFLNARPEFGDERLYTVQLRVGDIDIEFTQNSRGCGQWSGNPLKKEVTIHYRDPNPDPSNNTPLPRGHKSAQFTAKDLKKFDGVSGKYVFINKDGDYLVLTPAKDVYVDYDALPTSKTDTDATQNEEKKEQESKA